MNPTPDLTATPHEVGLSSEGLERISVTTQKFIDDELLAGAVTIVARRGKVAHFEAFGMMDIEADKSMQRDTIFRIYSMSKPTAAVGVMMLCEEGKLELDAPASKYMPEFSDMKVVVDPDADEVKLVDVEREMTVRDLLRHSSGLPGAALYTANKSALGVLYRQAGLNRFHEGDLQDMVEKLGMIPLLYQPGTKWHYSIAADVLGRLIEIISGQSFDVFLAKRIFEPLEMEDTGFYVPAKNINRLAGMYGPSPDGGLQTIDAPQGGTNNYSTTSFIERPKFLSAGGGLVSTANDFMQFCLMLSNKGTLAGKRLLNAESIEEMTRNQLPEHLIPLDKKPDDRYSGLGFGLGFSVRVYQTDWVPASQVGEYGWIGGTSTEFWISPRDELIAITLVQHMPFSKVSESVKQLVYAAVAARQKVKK